MKRRVTVRSSWMIGSGLLLACAYKTAIRPRLLRWGATDDELKASMPGDDDIQRPILAATRAVTINAPPSAVWPWIVQIGYHRAGWYAYDLFDNDDIPSAESIMPEFQQLEIGQVIGEEGNAVREILPERHLLLGFHHPKVEWVFKQVAEVRERDALPAAQAPPGRSENPPCLSGANRRAGNVRADSAWLLRTG